MINSKIHWLLITFCLSYISVNAEENHGLEGRKAQNEYARLTSGCAVATSQVDLDINNVRARLLNAGDFWWDLNNGRYVVPKVDVQTGAVEVSSSFAGALWIGGIDAGGQLKIASQTYRQSGNDFWPGPLSPDGSIDEQTCSDFDNHWKINATDIDNFNEYVASKGGAEAIYASGVEIPSAEIPKAILEWPAKGNLDAVGKAGASITVDKNLAPFIDANFNGIYDPKFGDYPDIDGDQAIFWVYNDKGNIHTETGGDAIGLEIQLLAFAFATNDEINNMTFYRYNVINYATTPLDSTYFGQWIDSDVGCYSNDWVGCDTALSLGMCFNGTSIDEPCPTGYGANPPIFGTDFFQGPTKYIYSGGAIVDSVRLGMSAFLFYNNDFTNIGNPEVASHYYGYLTGTWKDGTPFTYGGNGHGGAVPFNYVFPSDPSDPTGWSECTENNTPFDRRYLQSSGPFRLEPGAKNQVVVGALWVRPAVSGACSTTFDDIRVADQKAQALFDANFQLIGGPDAPDMSIRELDNEIILSLTNGPTSNNIGESYSEADPIIVSLSEEDPTITDTLYKFQGYKIYQLKDGTVSASDYGDPTKAKLIYQCDLNDGIDKIVNYTFDQLIGADVPTLEVDGANTGIQHTFQVTDDAFATGSSKLVDFKTYYFSVVAYSYNNYLPYIPGDEKTQKRPYLEGRKNIKVYTAIPHKPSPEYGGLTLNAAFGDGPEITKIEGMGNGGNYLRLTEVDEAKILADNGDLFPVYQGRHAPVDVMVYDPVRLPAADFEIKFVDSTNSNPVDKDSTWWVLTNTTTGETVVSDFPINFVNQQIIPEWGLAVTVKDVANPGGSYSAGQFIPNPDNNGFVGASIDFADPNKSWLTGVPDIDGSVLDWIRAGVPPDPASPSGTDFYPNIGPNNYDEGQVFEGVLGGTWSPFYLVAQDATVSGVPIIYMPLKAIVGLKIGTPNFLSRTVGVDIVLTPDKSKWSHCVVVQTGESPDNNPNGEAKLDMRQHGSMDQNGNYSDPALSKGLSWFPGYAINVENGQRLNIIFGEDGGPGIDQPRGDDMIWNPSDVFFDDLGNPVYGRKHYIYVSNTPYDEGNTIHGLLEWVGGVPANSTNLKAVYQNVVWISMPFLNPGYTLLPLNNSDGTGLIPTETRVELRVTRQYEQLFVTGENNSYPKYKFSTTGLAASVNDQTVASAALDIIRAVPNPYYAYSAYENSALDNRIKITNLPSSCTVSIYSLDGTLVRRFTRAVATDNTSGGELNSKTGNLDTSLDWDLTNEKNVPIASGMYIIHIDAGALGEKTIKWFGIMRPIDLDTF